MKTQATKKRRSFVKTYKKGLKLTSEGVKVSVSWNSDYLDRKGLREWFMNGLHRKINWNGLVSNQISDFKSLLNTSC